MLWTVLISPHKRAIYDSVGLKGLGQDGLQIVIHSKTPREIREEYERLAKEQEEKQLEKLTFSEGNFSVRVDATNVFEGKKYYQNESSQSYLRWIQRRASGEMVQLLLRLEEFFREALTLMWKEPWVLNRLCHCMDSNDSLIGCKCKRFRLWRVGWRLKHRNWSIRNTEFRFWCKILSLGVPMFIK